MKLTKTPFAVVLVLVVLSAGGDDVVAFVKSRDLMLVLNPDDPAYPYTGALNAKLDEVQGNIEQAIQAGRAAGNRGATLVDVGAVAETLWGDPGNYFDCNHLSEQGNSMVADLFLWAIQNTNTP